MLDQEIEVRDLYRTVGRHWKLLAALVLVPATLVVVLGRLAPDRFSAAATLVVHRVAASENALAEVDSYRRLLASDSVLAEVSERLIRGGVLEKRGELAIGRNLKIEVPAASPTIIARGVTQTPFFAISVEAIHEQPQAAAEIANTWAEVFVEKNPVMMRSPLSQRDSALERRLPEIREQIEALDAETSRLVEEFAAREAEVLEEYQGKELRLTADWDRRIASAEEATEKALAEHHGETRRLMEEAVARPATDPAAAAAPFAPPAELLEILSVRAELARTPRVLTLEKAASDETLAEMLVTGTQVDHFDSTLITQEINPIYDRLSVMAVELENDLRRQTGPSARDISGRLRELETIQLQRGAELAAMLAVRSQEPRSQRRRRSFALRTLWRERDRALSAIDRERTAALQEVERRQEQLRSLEVQVREALNSAVLVGLFEQAATVTLASRAVPPSRPIPARTLRSAFVVALAGGALGLAIALMRAPVPTRRAADAG